MEEIFQRPAAPPQEASAGLALESGEMIDDYRVLRLIGRGGVGEVYLAQDTRLGRKVALKVVTQDALRQPAARERFLREARMTAQFAHPHIVTIHGAGEVDGFPYVALEYLPGQTLRERMDERRPGLREALRLGLAMAEALVEAHRHQVLHRDLKPQNIIIPRDGRLRVVDFGLAKRLPSGEPGTLDGLTTCVGDAVDTVDDPGGDMPTTAATVRQDFQSRVGGLLGTPAYMAPEQWLKAPVSAATDIWALGAILYELLAGRHPFGGAGFYQLCHHACSDEPMPSLAEVTDGVPEVLVALVDRCLRKVPGDRPTAREVAGVLDRLLAGPDRRAQDNPFRGLLPFGERHADLFFGRDVELDTFLERLRSEAVLPVVGPSGAGKSSFVQAGVIPRLRDQGSWLVLRMRPGRQPFEALAARLIAGESTLRQSRGSDPVPITEPVDQDEPTHLAERELAMRLAETPGRLSLELDALARDRRVMLFVDQLEELYTLVESEETRQGFMRALCATVGDPAGAVRVVFTLRDDFLGRMAEGAEAREVLSRVTVVRAPGPAALRQILERPLTTVGYAFEDATLAQDMVAEVAGEDAALPLLQSAGQQLWERRDQDRRLVTRQAYADLGGVAGALAQHTDATLGGLSPDQERLAQRIFLRLVTPRLTRQVLPRSRLLEGLGPGAPEVLERLTGARTILVRKGPDEAELELVHESLIRTWDRLARWLDESREERQFLAEVGQAAELWQQRGRPVSEVWLGAALAEAQRKARACQSVPDVVRAFLEAGVRRQDRAQRRRRMVWTAVVVAAVAVALGAVGVSLLVRRKEREAVRQRNTARMEKRRAVEKQQEALRNRGAALREGARAALAMGSLIEARAKLRAALELGDSALTRSLWQRLGHQPLRWQRDLGAAIQAVAFSPDGATLAAASHDHSVHLFDVSTGARRVLRGHVDPVMSVAFAPDGRRLATGTLEGAVRIWTPGTGASIPVVGHRSRVRTVAFRPGGRQLATGSDDETVRLWDAATGRPLRVLRGHRGHVKCVAFSPDGKTLASASHDKTIRLWDAATGRLLRVLEGHEGYVLGVTFSPRGQSLASASSDRTVRLWDLSTGRQRLVLRGHTAQVWSVAFRPDGRQLVSGGSDKTLRLWAAATGQELRLLRGHKGIILGVAFSPDGQLIASASSDGTLRLWEARFAPSHGTPGHEGTVLGVAFSPDGKTIASGGTDKTIRLWETGTGRTKRVLRGHGANVWSVAFGPQGRHLASASSDRTVRLWDAQSGRLLKVLKGHQANVMAVAFSPDGRRVASAGTDRTVRLWDVASGRQLHVLTGHGGPVWTVAFSPRGGRLASASSDKTVRIWDLSTGRTLRVLRGHTRYVFGVAFGPRGQQLASASYDKTLRIWDPATGALQKTLGPYASRVYWVSFLPDGGHLAFTSADRKARVVALASGRTVVLTGHQGEVNFLAVSPNGQQVVTGSDDATLRLWDAHSGQPVWRAPLLRPDPPELFSHRGARRLDLPAARGSAPQHPPGAAWRRAVEQRARLAVEAGGRVCLSTGDRLEIWEVSTDLNLLHTAVPGITDVVAVPVGPLPGCVTLSQGTARLHRPVRAGRQEATSVLLWRKSATAIAWGRDKILVAAGGKVMTFSPEGASLKPLDAPVGIRALARVSRYLALGYADGGLELLPLGSAALRKGFSFDQPPHSPVVRLRAGPPGTLIAGFADGQFGLWSLSHGDRLLHGRLHGPVAHLRVYRQKLYAASALGGFAVMDLAPLYTPYCTLLLRVWRDIPIVWENGLPVRRSPPRHHSCR